MRNAWPTVRALAAAIALGLVAAGQYSLPPIARAEEPADVRRLPPVSRLAPATVLPAPAPAVVSAAVSAKAPPAATTIASNKAPASRPAVAPKPPSTAVPIAQSAPAPSKQAGVTYPEAAPSRVQSFLAPSGPPIRRTSREEFAFTVPRAPSPFLLTAEQEEVPGEPVPPPPDEPVEPGKPSATRKADGEPQTFGQAPVSNALQFLREQDVLLEPGDWQFDTGFAYTLFDDDFPFAVLDGGGNVVGVIQGHIRDRLIYTPLAVRYGWSTNVQLFAALPTGISATQFSVIGDSVTQTTGGIGDLTAGAQLHLLCGEETFPDVVATLAVTAPTGDFNAPVGSVIPGAALGQGFWAFGAQLLFINRYDPVIAFYGVGYRHLFEREFDQVLFAPGEQFSYQFGVGFAPNDRVTLSTTFFGFFISNALADRTQILGSNVEPMSLRFAATIVRHEHIVEPFVQVGMTDFAPAASFGVTFTFF
ncbi:MAG: hypothetical protein AB7O59_20660 [Pirellulales bacterium]